MYELQPAQEGQSDMGLFFRLSGEAAERHGSVGYFRADFAKSGREFHFTWFDSQPHLKTPAFKKEFEDIINSLRDDGEKPPLASRSNLQDFCLSAFGTSDGGASIRTQNYSYYFRCKPSVADYDIYCMAYDNRYLLPELAGQHGLPNYCFCVLPSTGEMIRVVRGESGYYPCNSAGMSPETIRFKVNDENQLRGVTRAQEEAMLAGSLFGWHTAAAKPWNYDQDGKPRPPQPKKNEPER